MAGAAVGLAAAQRPAAPWVRAAEASSWLRALASMGTAFPAPGAGEVAWARFEHAAFKVPGLLVVLGACMAVALPALLCCCPAPAGLARGSPSWSGCIATAFFTALCLVTGLVACIRLGFHNLTTASKALRQATLDVWKAKRYTIALNASGVAVLEDLALMYDACPQDAQDYLGNSVSGIESSVRSYNEVALRLGDTIVSLPRQLVDAQKAGVSLGTFYTSQMALPSLLLVAVCCGAVAGAVAIQEWAGPRVARRCDACKMPLLSLALVGPVVVLLCVAASMELSLGIELAAFCSDADGITLEYAAREFGNDSYGFNMTRYYLTGGGSNEALSRLSLASGDISSCIQWMQKYRPIIERTCPAWRPWNVTVNLQAVLISLNQTQQLLAPSQVYGHYAAVVRDFACSSALSGLGWVVTSQVLLGLILLPMLSFRAGLLLKGLSAEREMGHRFDLIPQDDDSEVGSRRQGWN